ncbi:hypothetical protein [Terripilifer ovatus]|uniref:hypothetical protein n=1 Tax=Terripilifer ovatus TaxID=3032367 RepID=UPI003AB9799C
MSVCDVSGAKGIAEAAATQVNDAAAAISSFPNIDLALPVLDSSYQDCASFKAQFEFSSFPSGNHQGKSALSQ